MFLGQDLQLKKYTDLYFICVYANIRIIFEPEAVIIMDVLDTLDNSGIPFTAESD